MRQSSISAPSDEPVRMPAAELVDRLIAIRDELVAGVAPVFVLRRIWDLVDAIEVDAATAAEQIAVGLPRLCGGSPEVNPATWPASLDPDLDGFRWAPTFNGPLPLSVLAESAPFNADYDAWLDRLDAARDCWSDADQLAAHGCV